MPFYDRRCKLCGATQIDCWERMNDDEPIACPCGGKAHRLLLPNGNRGVIGDECDVTVKHGLCNSDGSPRRYTSKTEMRREAEKRGLTNHVTHLGDARKGSDKSKFTSRWI